MSYIIAPSLLAADFLNLETELEKINSTDCEWLHLDVMDGVFVPNLTFGYELIQKINMKTRKKLDVHLMITNPEKSVLKYIEAGAKNITFHYEALNSDGIEKIIKEIKDKNVKVAMAINPRTKVDVLLPFIKNLDMILIMSVEPGFGGQKFKPECLEKIRFFSKYKTENNLNYKIQVDGGINESNVEFVKNNGCNVIVAGSYLFSQDMQEKIDILRS